MFMALDRLFRRRRLGDAGSGDDDLGDRPDLFFPRPRLRPAVGSSLVFGTPPRTDRSASVTTYPAGVDQPALPFATHHAFTTALVSNLSRLFASALLSLQRLHSTYTPAAVSPPGVFWFFCSRQQRRPLLRRFPVLSTTMTSTTTFAAPPPLFRPFRPVVTLEFPGFDADDSVCFPVLSTTTTSTTTITAPPFPPLASHDYGPRSNFQKLFSSFPHDLSRGHMRPNSVREPNGDRSILEGSRPIVSVVS